MQSKQYAIMKIPKIFHSFNLFIILFSLDKIIAIILTGRLGINAEMNIIARSLMMASYPFAYMVASFAVIVICSVVQHVSHVRRYAIPIANMVYLFVVADSMLNFIA